MPVLPPGVTADRWELIDGHEEQKSIIEGRIDRRITLTEVSRGATYEAADPPPLFTLG